MNDTKYAGFWIRTGAALIDSLLVLALVAPIFTLIYGKAFWLGQTQASGLVSVILNYILPAIAVIAFWIYKSATPGKMALHLRIVDATTGGKPSSGQLIGRYFAYYVSIIPLCLGITWVGIDKRKQGWHDKLANTLVVRDAPQDHPPQ